MEDERITESSEKAKVGALIKEYQRCSPWEGNYWNRLGTNDEIRYGRWPGKNSEGRKRDANMPNGKHAFPWDGASDTTIPLADEIIGERVAIGLTAFWRAMAQPKMGESESSAYSVALIDYLMNSCMAGQLLDQVELSIQYQDGHGWYVLHPRWETEITLRREKVTLEQLLGIIQAYSQPQPVAAGPGGARAGGGQMAPGPLAGITADGALGLIENPETETEAMEVLAAIHQVYAGKIEGEIAEHLEVKVPPLSAGSLRRAVRDLRESGETELTLPRITRNEPSIICLKPWEEVALAPDCTDIKRGPVFQRVFWDEVELKRRELTEGLDANWVAQAWEQRGQMSQWGPMGPMNEGLGKIHMFGDGAGFMMYDAHTELVEVIYATYWALDADGAPGLCCTVFHPKIPGLAGWHGLLEMGAMPYVLGRREALGQQALATRGIPEITRGWQGELKSQRDAAIDLLSLAVCPPLNVFASSMKVNYRFGPAVQNTVIRGQEPQFMQVPQSGFLPSVEMADRIHRDAARYFGRAGEGIDPQVVIARTQHFLDRLIRTWTDAFAMVLELCRIHMPDRQFAEITGAPEGWLNAKRQQEGLFYADLHFDARELDPEFMEKQLGLINTTVLPADTTGAIDRRKLTMLQLRAINPRLARELISDQTAASQKMFDAVQNDIALMFLGNAPRMVENDPTAQTKLQFAQQIVQANPTYVAALQRPGRFAELMQMYAKNLGFSLTQEKNKQIGRIGVDPEGNA